MADPKLSAKAKKQKRADDGKFSKTGGGGKSVGGKRSGGGTDAQRLKSWDGKGSMPPGWRGTETFKAARKALKTRMRVRRVRS